MRGAKILPPLPHCFLSCTREKFAIKFYVFSLEKNAIVYFWSV